MIDTDRQYTTRAGATVTIHQVVPRTSTGAEATFPLKGTVSELVKVRHRNRYQIWTMDGRADIFDDHPDDIIDLRGDE